MSLKKDEMLVMPAVDIKNGKCVQLVQGEPGSEMVEIENPELVAKHWEDLGAKNIHVIDLDGTINGVASFDVIKKILDEVSVPIQLGGGIRSTEYARQLLDLDIESMKEQAGEMFDKLEENDEDIEEFISKPAVEPKPVIEEPNESSLLERILNEDTDTHEFLKDIVSSI